jgi:hypothetical protein
MELPTPGDAVDAGRRVLGKRRPDSPAGGRGAVGARGPRALERNPAPGEARTPNATPRPGRRGPERNTRSDADRTRAGGGTVNGGISLDLWVSHEARPRRRRTAAGSHPGACAKKRGCAALFLAGLARATRLPSRAPRNERGAFITSLQSVDLRDVRIFVAHG